MVVLILYAVTPGPLGLSRLGYGLLLSCFAVWGVAGAAATKRLVRRVGRGKLLAGSVFAIAIGLAGPGMLVDPYTAGSALAVADSAPDATT